MDFTAFTGSILYICTTYYSRDVMTSLQICGSMFLNFDGTWREEREWKANLVRKLPFYCI